ncbi:hypothetical protein Cgig2_004582 [Carnegiea gigantea]|uniref:Uncharacterized protein n=1 Tax=Carnegiea gigantea TaxID=171969 RepID=A0A9Q1JXJ3_9CARY|nr:hypothetical protein Cgig2_004582 [Carnegiea gigantea]
MKGFKEVLGGGREGYKQARKRKEHGGMIKEFFKWSYNETLVVCDVIIQCIVKNGHGQCIKWREIEKEVTHRIGHHENLSSKSFEIKVSTLLEENWEHIYGDAYATGKNIYVPTLEPPIINIEEHENDHQAENHMEERLGEEGNLHMYNLQGNSYFQSVLVYEDNFYKYFVKCVSNGNDDQTKKAIKGSAMWGAQIKHMVASCKIMSQGGSTRMSKQQSSMSTITTTMKIVNRMCYDTHVLEDSIKQEIFLNMDDDGCRLKWLQYLHRMKDN